MVDYLDFRAPEGLRVRGTLLVVPGRGEGIDTYRRFGSRIAADAYRVRVLSTAATSYVSPGSFDKLVGELSAAVVDLGKELTRPLVLVGTDASAAALAALVAGSHPDAPWWPDAVILAALPGFGPHDIGTDWESELAARTHCPVHRGVLTTDTSVSRGTISSPLSDGLLDHAYGSTVALPHLLLVGDRDPIADLGALTRLTKALPTARLAVVRGAHHDVLNDLQHRSVAAEVVSFLEVLRDGNPLQRLVTVDTSAW
jgi:alpha-beta hydrolase superfamily lysophospholipase